MLDFTDFQSWKKIIRDCVTYTEYRQRKTVTINDVSGTLPSLSTYQKCFADGIGPCVIGSTRLEADGSPHLRLRRCYHGDKISYEQTAIAHTHIFNGQDLEAGSKRLLNEHVQDYI